MVFGCGSHWWGWFRLIIGLLGCFLGCWVVGLLGCWVVSDLKFERKTRGHQDTVMGKSTNMWIPKRVVHPPRFNIAPEK